MLEVSGLFIYPIKSMGGISVASARVTDRGLEYDRRWMLVDEQNRFISQREVSELALFIPEITPEGLYVTYKQTQNSLLIPFKPLSNKSIMVTIWDDTCLAQLVSTEADKWFSDILGKSCRLAYMPDECHRIVDPNYAPSGKINSFSDGYPFLLLGENSIHDLSNRVGKQIPINRFRPNIVFSGGEAYMEDAITAFTIGNIHFSGVKLCARCPIPGIDQDTAIAGAEPLKTLASYRRKANKIWMGQNLIHSGTGTINIGDTIIVSGFKESMRFD